MPCRPHFPTPSACQKARPVLLVDGVNHYSNHFPLGLSIGSIAPVNLLLQHDAVHTGLEQRKGQARLALEFAEAVEDLGAGVGGEVFEDVGELRRMRVSRVSCNHGLIYTG